jgi:hypothetical protein
VIARARRRGGTIALVYAVHACIALVIAWPQSGLLSDRTAALPGGDRVLFEPGGLYLLEAFRLSYPSMVSAARGDLLLLVLAGYLGLLPLGALVTALDRPARVDLRELIAGAGACFGRYSVLLGLALLSMGFATAACLLSAGALGLSPLSLPDTRGGAVALVAAYSVLGLLLSVLGVLHDLARASVVRHDADVWSALSLAASTLRQRPVHVLIGWAARTAAGLALVGASIAFAAAVSIVPAGGFFAIAFLDQLVAAALVALRASWLALALRLVGDQGLSGERDRYTRS